MSWLVIEMLEGSDLLIADFRRDHLRRVVIFLAVMVWLIGTPVMLLTLSPLALIAVVTFEALCIGVLFLIYRGLATPAHLGFSIGMIVWCLGLVWWTREPVFLALPMLLAPILVNQINLRLATLLSVVLMTGSVLFTRFRTEDMLGSDQIWLFPLLTFVALGIAFLYEGNFATVVGWMLQSTRNALDRLTEVQEHRARLVALTRDLDHAYHRLERVNEMLVAARAEAEEARQARQQFALVVSHELRTPLNLIIGFSELMVNAPHTYADPSAWPAGLYDDVQEIYRSSKHLLGLVNDVLDLGKADARKLVLIKEWVTPESLVQEVAAIMQPALNEKGLWLHTEIAPNLPELFVDRTRIRQVLINLLGNSLRFTEHGGVTITVTRRNDETLFCVRDTGPGIPPEEASKVFEDFGQVSATVWRRRDGAGLGVPISRRLVAMHGGQMWMESQVGCGTSFYFTLPLPGGRTDVDLSADLDMTEYWKTMADHSRTSRLVLIVSPDPNAGDLLRDWLPEHRVITTDLSSARVQITSLLPQAVILDGAIASKAEVRELLAELPYDPPVLTLDLPGNGAPACDLTAGITSYLTKPVLRLDLVKAVRRLGAVRPLLLVIDDDPAVARFVKLALAEENGGAGFEVVSKTTGASALDWLETTNQLPGAILLDLKLPDTSGWDVVHRLQESPAWCALPVIVITAVSLTEELEAQGRKSIEISTMRSLTLEEQMAVVTASLKAIPAKFPANPVVSGRPGNRVG